MSLVFVGGLNGWFCTLAACSSRQFYTFHVPVLLPVNCDWGVEIGVEQVWVFTVAALPELGDADVSPTHPSLLTVMPVQ